MEQNSNQNVTKIKKSQSNSFSVRVTKDGQKRLTTLLNRANKKDFGKKIKGHQLIEFGLSLITDSHIKSIQENSLSNSDLLELKFRDYVKKNGKISKDDFLGILLEQNYRNDSQEAS